MSEYTGADFTDLVRETTNDYDQARRLTGVGFDDDGDETVDETVSYQYDVAGRRTQMTMPGSLDVTYTYDQRGAVGRPDRLGCPGFPLHFSISIRY